MDIGKNLKASREVVTGPFEGADVDILECNVDLEEANDDRRS